MSYACPDLDHDHSGKEGGREGGGGGWKEGEGRRGGGVEGGREGGGGGGIGERESSLSHEKGFRQVMRCPHFMGWKLTCKLSSECKHFPVRHTPVPVGCVIDRH